VSEIGPSTILNKLHGRSATVGNIHDLRDHIIAHAGASGVTYPVAGIDAVATSPVIYYALFSRVARHALQFRGHLQDASHQPRDGGWHRR
jgi:hypothetical protein